MSKRTFIPRWGSSRKPPAVFGRCKSVRGLAYRSPQPKILTADNDDGRLRWHTNPAPQALNQGAPITRERLTQRVGLFRNAKHSEVVISGISNAVKRACHKQINRLVTSDGTYDLSPARDVDQIVVANAGSVGRQSQKTSAGLYCDGVDDCDLVRVETNNPRCYVMRRNDSGYELQASHGIVALQRECRRNGSPCIIVDEQEHTHKKVRQRLLRKRTSKECDTHSDTQVDEDYHINQQPLRVTSKIMEEQPKMMQTPESSDLSQKTNTRRSSNVLSLSLASARILSALPPIYLRDDHHDKYDTVAVRLLSESITRNETKPGSADNIFRSFLDRTGCIAIEEARSQLNDNEYENIFQNYSDFDALAGEHQDTPELEKLFNQTVCASKLDDDPEFLHYVNSKYSKLASISRQTSSLMTPVSSGSRRPATTSPTKNVGTLEDCTASLSYNFPFSRSSSSSSNSSPSDDINFEWSIPKAGKDQSHQYS